LKGMDALRWGEVPKDLTEFAELRCVCATFGAIQTSSFRCNGSLSSSPLLNPWV
jgi:hypothetical protein